MTKSVCSEVKNKKKKERRVVSSVIRYKVLAFARDFKAAAKLAKLHPGYRDAILDCILFYECTPTCFSKYSIQNDFSDIEYNDYKSTYKDAIEDIKNKTNNFVPSKYKKDSKRVAMSFSRFIRRVVNLDSFKLADKVLDELHGYLFLLPALSVKEYTGEDISKKYVDLQDHGIVSCMSHRRDYTELYAANPDVVKLFVFSYRDKYVRALAFRDIKGQWWCEKLYRTNDPSFINAIMFWLDQRDIRTTESMKSTERTEVFIRLNHVTERLPYLDTFYIGRVLRHREGTDNVLILRPNVIDKLSTEARSQWTLTLRDTNGRMLLNHPCFICGRPCPSIWIHGSRKGNINTLPKEKCTCDTCKALYHKCSICGHLIVGEQEYRTDERNSFVCARCVRVRRLKRCAVCHKYLIKPAYTKIEKGVHKYYCEKHASRVAVKCACCGKFMAKSKRTDVRSKMYGFGYKYLGCYGQNNAYCTSCAPRVISQLMNSDRDIARNRADWQEVSMDNVYASYRAIDASIAKQLKEEAENREVAELV